ncbi:MULTISPECIES: MBL fold metallo-hydrolase [Legionella]|uniref:MBL fold metallo-hydrolase n=1 Tax=Legionella TaxID=445 RepID=UPI000F8C92D0|nr:MULTISPECIES: MBL fold metallo-hydrolase [Legionella]MCP0914864.1 MBL fold metallo-hydrolase [Legionella sp. 27cVA30]RUR02927.1 MBL fold metallo-hydrolase [Legionella septentrionalis]RUR16791.1 MBL fold metallo-hydrolase [Legionella septentrionalis]
MKLKFLGSGSAFVPITENFQSNMILESDSGKRLLIDCGTDIRHSLHSYDLTHQDIDAVYISHFHADHVGGLEWLAFTCKFSVPAKKPKLFIHPSMVETLWNHVLSGGLRSIADENVSIHTYFDLQNLQNETTFTWEKINFKLVKTKHVYDNGNLVPSFGLFFTNGKKNVFITTDTQFDPEAYMEYFNKADVIFHDCDLSNPGSEVHANYAKLLTLPPAIKAKMWLYHYPALPLPAAQAQGFKGFVRKGEVFEF